MSDALSDSVWSESCQIKPIPEPFVHTAMSGLGPATFQVTLSSHTCTLILAEPHLRKQVGAQSFSGKANKVHAPRCDAAPGQPGPPSGSFHGALHIKFRVFHSPT